MFQSKYKIHSFKKDELDITDAKQVEKKIKQTNPNIVLNCAAFTNVDQAEKEKTKLNYRVNTLGTYNLAKTTKKLDIDLITISSDYVFHGDQEDGYFENSQCNPINQYGMSKYLGEKLAQLENNNAIIIRTSRLYGAGKQFKNFVNKIIQLSESHDQLKVINDQYGAPTYTHDLSQGISKVIDNIKKYRSKRLHFTNSSTKPITRYEFALEICKLMNKKTKIIPCNSKEYKTQAQRPQHSYLKNKSNIQLRSRKEGLQEYIQKEFTADT